MRGSLSGEAATPGIANLKGKRAIFINETQEGGGLNEARVKYLGSSDPITGRHLHQESVTFTPTHKPFLKTNHRPKIRGRDHAIWKRIGGMHYSVTIAKKDIDKRFFEKMILPELPGILNWMLEWLREYLKDERLNPPDVVLKAVEEYKMAEDVIGKWVDMTLERKAGIELRLSHIKARCETWAFAEEGWKKVTSTQIAKTLRDKGYESVIKTGNYTVFKDVGFRDTASNSDLSSTDPDIPF